MENFDLVKFSELCKAIPMKKKQMTQREKIEYEDKMNAFDMQECEAFKYLKATIYALKDGTYLHSENGEYVIDTLKSFNESYGMRIKALNEELYDMITKKNIRLYNYDVYDEDFQIDDETMRINMKVPLDFKKKKYIPTKEDIKALEDFTEFIKNIVCDGDVKMYEYQMLYLSLIFKQKQTSTVYNLFSQLEGSGKTTFITFLKKICGPAMTIITTNQVSGKDNFNHNMMGKTILYLEEVIAVQDKATAESKQFFETLKQLATATEYSYRNMYMMPKPKRNISNVVVSSNNRVLVGRRTYCPFFNCSKTEDKIYFSRIKGIIENDNHMQHIFNYIMNINITIEDFLKIEIPKTEILAEEIQDKLPSYYKFVKEIFLYREADKRIKTTTMYEMYRDWYLNRINGDVRYISGKTTLYQCLLELGFRKVKLHGDYYFNFDEETKQQVMRIYVTKKWVTQEEIDDFKKKNVGLTEQDVKQILDEPEEQGITTEDMEDIEKINRLVIKIVAEVNKNYEMILEMEREMEREKERKQEARQRDNERIRNIKSLSSHFDVLEKYM